MMIEFRARIASWYGPLARTRGSVPASVMSPWTSSIRAATSGPAASMRARARSSIARSMSTPTTRWPSSASGTAMRPLPTASSRIGPPVRRASARNRSTSPGSTLRSRSYRRAIASAAVSVKRATRRRPRPSAGTGPRWPARRFTASAEIASRATRFAIIAVDSAQSYGGETSTMSMPASSTAPTIWRTARSSSRGSIPPGSGVPVPGAEPGSTTSMSTDR